MYSFIFGYCFLSLQYAYHNPCKHTERLPNKRLWVGSIAPWRGNRIYSNGDMCERWSRRAKLGEGEKKKRVKEGNYGGTNNSNPYLGSQMEIYYCRIFSKYNICERNLKKWNHQNNRIYIYIHMSYVICVVIIFSPRAIDYLNKNSSARNEKPISGQPKQYGSCHCH